MNIMWVVSFWVTTIGTGAERMDPVTARYLSSSYCHPPMGNAPYAHGVLRAPLRHSR